MATTALSILFHRVSRGYRTMRMPVLRAQPVYENVGLPAIRKVANSWLRRSGSFSLPAVRSLAPGDGITHGAALSVGEHEDVATRLHSMQTAALALLRDLDGRVPENDVGQARILLNVIGRLTLLLEDTFSRDHDVPGNPYSGKVIWSSDKS